MEVTTDDFDGLMDLFAEATASLEEHLPGTLAWETFADEVSVRDAEVVGSNPAVPTQTSGVYRRQTPRQGRPRGPPYARAPSGGALAAGQPRFERSFVNYALADSFLLVSHLMVRCDWFPDS